MKVSRGGRSCPEKAPPAQVTALHATASVRRQFLRSVAGTRPPRLGRVPQAGTLDKDAEIPACDWWFLEHVHLCLTANTSG